MIQLEIAFENTKLDILKEEFMSALKTQLTVSNIPIDNFNLTTQIKKEHMPALTNVIHDYLFKILGIQINNLNVVGYVDDEELYLLDYLHIKCNKCSGMETKAFYNKLHKTIYIEINKQLKGLLPVLFHEFIHAYIHENNIKITDDYPMEKDNMCFTFASKMHEANQEEGLCELASSLMCLHIFNTNQYPSNVDKYWLGWRLCVQGFLEFFEFITKNKEKCDAIFVTKMSFKSLVNILIKNQNAYKFVNKVPKDAYQRTKCIEMGM